MATSSSTTTTTTTAHNSQVFISSRVTLFKFANEMQGILEDYNSLIIITGNNSVLRFNMASDRVHREHNNHHNGWSDTHYNSTIAQMEAIVNVYQSQVRSDDDDSDNGSVMMIL